MIIGRTTAWLIGLSFPTILLFVGAIVGYMWRRVDVKLDTIDSKLGDKSEVLAGVMQSIKTHDTQIGTLFEHQGNLDKGLNNLQYEFGKLKQSHDDHMKKGYNHTVELPL